MCAQDERTPRLSPLKGRANFDHRALCTYSPLAGLRIFPQKDPPGCLRPPSAKLTAAAGSELRPGALSAQALELYGQLISEHPDLALAEYGRIGRAMMLYQVRQNGLHKIA